MQNSTYSKRLKFLTWERIVDVYVYPADSHSFR